MAGSQRILIKRVNRREYRVMLVSMLFDEEWFDSLGIGHVRIFISFVSYAPIGANASQQRDRSATDFTMLSVDAR